VANVIQSNYFQFHLRAEVPVLFDCRVKSKNWNISDMETEVNLSIPTSVYGTDYWYLASCPLRFSVQSWMHLRSLTYLTYLHTYLHTYIITYLLTYILVITY